MIASSALFWAATSNAVYETTSPSWLSWHVVLRKLYSVGAFALVAALLTGSLAPGRRIGMRVVLALAAYSCAIEIAQYVNGAREGLALNALDVFCGAVGGVLGFACWRSLLGPLAQFGDAHTTMPKGPTPLANGRREP